jgi:hypothetical protein
MGSITVYMSKESSSLEFAFVVPTLCKIREEPALSGVEGMGHLVVGGAERNQKPDPRRIRIKTVPNEIFNPFVTRLCYG